MLRSFALTAVVSAGLMALGMGACKEASFPDDESLELPDRTDLPVTDSATTAETAVPPRDSSVPDTVVVDAADAAPPSLRVFVTSSTSNANLGGRVGADNLCKNLATTAGLTGTWAAWLSNEDGLVNDAIDRVTSTGPWRLVTGNEVVATTKAQLISGTLAHAIDRDEKGVAVAVGSRVWTGTGANGKYSTNDCNKWGGGGSNGRVGVTSATNTTWTTVDIDDCGSLRRVYCFQLTL